MLIVIKMGGSNGLCCSAHQPDATVAMSFNTMRTMLNSASHGGGAVQTRDGVRIHYRIVGPGPTTVHVWAAAGRQYGASHRLELDVARARNVDRIAVPTKANDISS